ncbi:MAG: tRNA uridine-5-carboxymethylaminomethyl(34) synthesis GTPase MnmE, partial [Ignavibacteria bacterium]|nr:tRNA uridine-5-carboxymethylaminomethyl(34) synthesis GTPase MnmE [Ignavibacteria bacterium]
MQSKLQRDDTIAAVATPPGTGAIGVIRLSGENAIQIVSRMFRGHVNLADAKGGTVHYGRIVGAGGETVDEVLVSVFRSP